MDSTIVTQPTADYLRIRRSGDTITIHHEDGRRLGFVNAATGQCKGDVAAWLSGVGLTVQGVIDLTQPAGSTVDRNTAPVLSPSDSPDTGRLGVTTRIESHSRTNHSAYVTIDGVETYLGSYCSRARAETAMREYRFDMAIDGHCPEQAAKIAMEEPIAEVAAALEDFPCPCLADEPPIKTFGVSPVVDAIKLIIRTGDALTTETFTRKRKADKRILALLSDGYTFDATHETLAAPTDYPCPCLRETPRCRSCGGQHICAPDGIIRCVACASKDIAYPDYDNEPGALLELLGPRAATLVEGLSAAKAGAAYAVERAAATTSEPYPFVTDAVAAQRILGEIAYTGTRCPECQDDPLAESATPDAPQDGPHAEAATIAAPRRLVYCEVCGASGTTEAEDEDWYCPAHRPPAAGERVFVMDQNDPEMFGRVAVVWRSEIRDPALALVRFEDKIPGHDRYAIYPVSVLERVRCLFCDSNAHPSWHCPKVAAERIRQEREEAAGRGIARAMRTERVRFLLSVAQCGDSDRHAMADALAGYLAAQTQLFLAPPMTRERILSFWQREAATQRS